MSLNTEYLENRKLFQRMCSNHDDPFEWLDLDKILKKGKQGYVGVLKAKDTNKKFVFKHSQYINYLEKHEHEVMKGLLEIASFCPHFCKPYGLMNVNVNLADRKNPFNSFSMISSDKLRKNKTGFSDSDSSDSDSDSSDTSSDSSSDSSSDTSSDSDSDTSTNSKSKKSFKTRSQSPVNLPNIEIRKDILMMEHVEGRKLSKYIEEPSIDNKIIYSAVKQVLLATAIASKQGFTHYDLHSDNIIMRKCNSNLIFVYVLDDKNIFMVPSHGYCPVIIDYGFSYIDSMKKEYLYPSLGHTSVGFRSYTHDPVYDSQLLCVTVAGELMIEREDSKARTFHKIIKNTFSPKYVDYESGWLKLGKDSVSDDLVDILNKYNRDLGNRKSKVFDHNNCYIIDLLQSLIKLPLKPRPKRTKSDLKRGFLSFISELIKIENQIRDEYLLLYIIKSTMDEARKVYRVYEKELREARREEERRESFRSSTALKKFRHNMYKIVDGIVDHFSFEDIDFEKILVSLMCMNECFEDFYYHRTQKLEKKVSKIYSKMPMNSGVDLYSCIELNIPSNYEYTKKNIFCVFDLPKKKTFCVSNVKNEFLKQMKASNSLSRGLFFYNHLVQQAVTAV